MTAETANDRHALRPWLVALAISGVFVLLIEINKHHYTAHRLGGRVVYAVMIWLAFATFFRFVAFLIEHSRGGPADGSPGNRQR